MKELKKAKPEGETKKERKKDQKRIDDQRRQMRVLVKYLDKDYAKIKESLNPMLENGLITFDLMWALWKPDTLAYATTYGSDDEPRAFKVETSERQSSLMRGDFYYIDGKYFEFDGKRFGFGGLTEEIAEFQGARRITSLPCYPLKYHKDEEGVRKKLVDRGKKFVSLAGVHYKAYKGIAYQKRRKGQITKFNIQHSRVMVDPTIFRRMNPNYYAGLVRPKDHDILSDDDDSSCGNSDGGDDDEDEEGGERIRYVTKVFKNVKGDLITARVSKDEADENADELDQMPEDDEEAMELTDEEYLIASPIVLGFAFSEKQWLEFNVSGVQEIQWNEDAWDSLVLEPATKDLIQALVKSRKYSAAQRIDDVIQGKGKGLVSTYPLPLPLSSANHISRPPRPTRHRQNPHRRRHKRAPQMPALHGLGGRTGDGLALPGRGTPADPRHLPRVGRDPPPRRGGRVPREAQHAGHPPQRAGEYIPAAAGVLPGDPFPDDESRRDV